MSKAFTKESDEDAPDDELPSEAELPGGRKNYITPAGYAHLQAELKELLNVQRPETVKIVSWAAALGDRSENADYLYGKKRLREIDKRVRFLTRRIAYAQIIDPTQQPQEKVYFGATVLVCDEHGTEYEYAIVGVDEIDLTRGRISWMSPMASALLGKSEGDKIIVRTPKGDQVLEILEVRYLALDA